MPEVFVIDGHAPLHGEVPVSGAKNSATKLLATALLAPGCSRLERVPRVAEVGPMSEVLAHLGAQVRWTGDNELVVDVPEELGIEAPYEPVRRMRASTAVLGPLVARTGRARVALPGGCNLGHRGIDLHVRGLEQLGASIELVHGYLVAEAPKLRGAHVTFDYPSHGATETLVMAASLAQGTTVIDNASREPEIHDLTSFLQRMGARISGVGTNRIEVEGVDRLKPASYSVMPDRLEAGTYAIAAVAAGGDVRITDMVPGHLELVFEMLQETGAEVRTEDHAVRVTADGSPKPVDVSTLPYPGFPTDLQPLVVAMLTRASGLSIVTENIFDGRFMFIDELARMGADVHAEGQYVVVRGVQRLMGAPVVAPDLRAGAALVVAGLTAEGRTVVEGLEQIDRGYENLTGKLQALGARVRRVPSDQLVEA
ncbi:MAG TPA: UDP-N-acetylglucosamine 1-carboxyvinyltransferase [Actinomycetota bacterium]|nr:UDP-N-acetylglucosamine 1-carboxyvinyltransferase [Actinomycetota bacterium]